MSTTVCLAARTLYYPQGGGHMWAYLNWALGFQSLGCRVIWLEGVDSARTAGEVEAYVSALRARLAPFGLADHVALWSTDGSSLTRETLGTCLDVDAAAEADLLLNQQYGMPADLVARFRCSALLDIDPGLFQMWLGKRLFSVAPHDVYFTIGETVGQPGARFSDAGLSWQYTPPCVALDWWPVSCAPEGAPFTTVTHWNMDEWEGDGDELYSNDKRTGFLPFLELPQHTNQPLELALLLGDYDQHERLNLKEYGWRVRDSHTVAATPQDYQRYIQGSRGEFSCVKPSCIRLQNAWISDRTICYLASGKPAVVQHTGPSRFLPDAAGLFRFRDLDEATRPQSTVAADYSQQSALARTLAEEYFDARKVTASVLERALP